MPRKKGQTKFKGCNEDCFHCPYPDCYKPVALIKKDKTVGKVRKPCGSQERRFTVTLGGRGNPSGTRYAYRSL